MIKIDKTFGVRGIANLDTAIRLQELIALSKNQYGWVGKALIDPEKITFSKFGLKLGIARLSTNGLAVDENGIIRNYGIEVPEVLDRQILTDICQLFGISASI